MIFNKTNYNPDPLKRDFIVLTGLKGETVKLFVEYSHELDFVENPKFTVIKGKSLEIRVKESIEVIRDLRQECFLKNYKPGDDCENFS